MQPVLSLSKGAPAILFAALLGVLVSLSNHAHAIAPGQQAAMASFVRPIPKNSFYFTGNTYGQTLQAAWIASITAGTGATGVRMVYPSPNQTAAPSITALGITSETGISPDGDGSCGGGACQGANYVTYMEGLLYTLRQAGVTKVWTNEGGAWNDSGTPPRLRDYNAIFQYWHMICPGCWIGMSMNGLSTNAYRDVPLFVQHGLIGLDFANDEEYGTMLLCYSMLRGRQSSYIDDTSAGSAYGFNQGYPNVQIGRLVYNHESLCGISPAIMAQVEFHPVLGARQQCGVRISCLHGRRLVRHGAGGCCERRSLYSMPKDALVSRDWRDRRNDDFRLHHQPIRQRAERLGRRDAGPELPVQGDGWK